MMKEYHIEFKYRSPDHVFVKIEDEYREEITVGSWENMQPGSDGTLVTLVLPAAPADPDLLEALENIGSYPALSPLDPISALDDMRQIARAAIALVKAQEKE